jgi:hypothetical protein
MRVNFQYYADRRKKTATVTTPKQTRYINKHNKKQNN